MDWLQTLLENSTTPVLTAFLLGLLTAISPCPLATNIAAIGYIGKDVEDRRRVFLSDCSIPQDALQPTLCLAWYSS